MNYNELFNVFYSNLSESVKISILDKIPSDFITEELNESSSEIGAYIELLDTLAYSSVSEATVESIIDEVFSGLSADVTEEILEAYVREKAIQYIEEALGHGTDAIGLSGLRKERVQNIQNKLKDRAQKQAFNRAKSELIHKGAELSQKAVRKGAELQGKAREFKKGISQKANDIRNTMANKAGEIKDKAVSGIKNAVGKVRDWAKKVGTDDSPIGLSQAIGRKAIENEKAGKSNFGDQVKTTTSSNSSANKASVATNAIKANASKTKVAQEVSKKKPAEVKTEAPKASTEAKPAKAKVTKPKTEAKPKVEKPKKEEVKAEIKKEPEKKPEVKQSKSKAKKEQQPKVEKAKKVETKKEEAKPVEETGKSKIKVKNVYTAHGDLKPSEKEKAKAEKVEAKKEEAKPIEAPKKEGQPKAEAPKVEAKKEEQPETKKEETKPKKEMSNLEKLSRQIDIEKKQQKEGKITNLKRDIDLYDKEIAGAEGKPSMMARVEELRKKKEEALKKLRELESQPAHEALSDLACLLAKTNISEEAFVEIMTMTNPIKKKENKKKRFEEIAKKRFKKRLN